MGPHTADNSALLKQLEEQDLYIAKCRSRIDQRDKQILELKERVELVTKENTKLHEIILLQRGDTSTHSQPHPSPQQVKASRPDISSKTLQDDRLQTRSLNPSIVDLRAKLSALNQDIFQAAASLGEGMVYADYKVSTDTWEVMKIKVERRIGSRLVSILQESQAAAKSKLNSTPTSESINTNPPVHSLLAQVTLQVFLADAVSCEIQTWPPQSGNAGLSKELSRIYKGLQVAEKQSVCTSWRALTSTQLPLAAAPTLWKEQLKKKLSYLFQIASWSSRDQAQLESFDRALGPIYAALLDIRTSLWGISDGEYETRVVYAGAKFDPTKMKEVYGDEDKARRHPGHSAVLGATSMGLCKVIADKDGFATNAVQIVAEAEVVVESSFRAVLSLGPGQSHADGRD